MTAINSSDFRNTNDPSHKSDETVDGNDSSHETAPISGNMSGRNIRFTTTDDGVSIAFWEIGAGKPVVILNKQVFVYSAYGNRPDRLVKYLI